MPASHNTSYFLFGRQINEPRLVQKIKDSLPAPVTCRCCNGKVDLVNNSIFYGGREYGWPLAYACKDCGARVGCHPGTDIPLGTLANKATMQARRAAHNAFDPLWKDKGPGARSRAYKALSRAMGIPAAHISWMDAEECLQVIQLIGAGHPFLENESPENPVLDKRRNHSGAIGSSLQLF